jgi:hypothetical protein
MQREWRQQLLTSMPLLWKPDQFSDEAAPKRFLFNAVQPIGAHHHPDP